MNKIKYKKINRNQKYDQKEFILFPIKVILIASILIYFFNLFRMNPHRTLSKTH